ncbi:hypothetical protein [uncultured Methylobacterium sp.]|uniref:hypothetical protein n=1 Tax=uncultured Methylobacterium sp. TaxID=157278 RepID=UPI0035CC00A7
MSRRSAAALPSEAVRPKPPKPWPQIPTTRWSRPPGPRPLPHSGTASSGTVVTWPRGGARPTLPGVQVSPAPSDQRIRSRIASRTVAPVSTSAVTALAWTSPESASKA